MGNRLSKELYPGQPLIALVPATELQFLFWIWDQEGLCSYLLPDKHTSGLGREVMSIAGALCVGGLWRHLQFGFNSSLGCGMLGLGFILVLIQLGMKNIVFFEQISLHRGYGSGNLEQQLDIW